MYNALMSMSDWVNANPLMSFALLLPLVTIYVMPMLIASERRHKHVNAIVVFNILTGWRVLSYGAQTSTGRRAPRRRDTT